MSNKLQRVVEGPVSACWCEEEWAACAPRVSLQLAAGFPLHERAGQ
jgi:hypothetical protein